MLTHLAMKQSLTIYFLTESQYRYFLIPYAILASSAVSTAFSWLPNRSPKRSTRAKSESLTESSSPRPSSASPVETLKSLCSQTDDGLPIFVIKCVEFIEKVRGKNFIIF